MTWQLFGSFPGLFAYYTATLTAEIIKGVRRVSAMRKTLPNVLLPLPTVPVQQGAHTGTDVFWGMQKGHIRGSVGSSGLSQPERAKLQRHHQHFVLHQGTASLRAGLGAGQAKALHTHPLHVIPPNSPSRRSQVNKLKYVMFGMYQCTQMSKSSRTTFVMHVFIPSFLSGDTEILIKSLTNT